MVIDGKLCSRNLVVTWKKFLKTYSYVLCAHSFKKLFLNNKYAHYTDQKTVCELSILNIDMFKIFLLFTKKNASSFKLI